jgi:hypothetical protein
MDFNSILDNVKKFLFPQVPPSQPMQKGQTVSTSPGYQELQAKGAFNPPPQQVDTNALGKFAGNIGSGIGNFIGGLIPKATYSYDFRSPAPSAAPTAAPAIASPVPQPTQSPAPNNLEDVIKKAYAAYGNPPVATLSAQLAKAGEGLPDPYLPAINALKETGGGRKLKYSNNFMNILAPGQQNYPNPESNIFGEEGDNRYSFAELLKTAPYAPYRESGDLADFFKVYTPDRDRNGVRNTNPTIAEQVALYNELRKQYFEPNL